MINHSLIKYITISFFIVTFTIFFSDICYAANNENIVTSSFLTELSNFVHNVLISSEIRIFINQIMLAFLFFVFIWEIIYFFYSGLDWGRILEKGIWCVTAFLILQFYDPITSAIWGMAEGLGADIQYIAVGNRDVYFLPGWSTKLFSILKTESVDIWDSIKIIALSIVWMFISGVLNLVLGISSFFSMFGYALAKITGIFFIPFIFFQGTRSYFDGWVKFFIGFVILAIILRINAVIIALLIKAQCSSVIGSSIGFVLPSNPIYLKMSGQGDLLTNLIYSGVIGIVFIISSFSFASALAAGSGSACGSIGKVINGAKKLLF